MMMILGMFVFMRETIAYQSFDRSVSWKYPSNSRIGKRNATQYVGLGDENISMSGVLLPEITGGKLSLLALEMMADSGRAWPLIEGTGTIYGFYIIESMKQTNTIFFQDGAPRRIEFSIELKRIDDSVMEALGEMIGDLKSTMGELGGYISKDLGF